MVKYHLSLLLACLTISGCSGFKAFEYHVSQTKRVKDAWKAFGPSGAGADYKDGWQTGYYDLSMGSDGQVPPVPPKKYWHSKYQNPVGQQLISDWYTGYQEGVIAAEHVGEDAWQLVPSSGVAALPSATIIDYPTYYNSPHGGENELPKPQPANASATSERHQLQQPPGQQSQQSSNEVIAAAAEPALDLRTLTGRPAVPTNESQPEPRQAISVPPAPSRDYERVPQPARQWPMVTDARENEQPAAPLARLNEPSPAISPDQYLASQPGHAELPRQEELQDLPRQHIEDVQPRNSNATSAEIPRRSPAPVVDRQQPPAANVREAAPLPRSIYSERLVMEWPASTAAPAPTTLPTPKESTNSAPSVALAQPTANPIANVEANASGAAIAPRSSTPGLLSAGEPIDDKALSLEAKTAEPKPQREQVVSQQPTPAAPSHSATPLGAPVVTPNPIVLRQFDVRDDSILRTLKADPKAALSNPTTKIAETLPETERASDSPADARWATRRESEPENDIASSPPSPLVKIVNVPTTRAPAKPAAEPAIARPARTHRPVVVAARPILVPTDVAANRMPLQTVESEKSAAPAPADRAVAKDLSYRTESTKAAQTAGPDKARQSLVTSTSGSIDPPVKMAAPFQLDSSDDPTKPIVLLARPVPLSGASTTRR